MVSYIFYFATEPNVINHLSDLKMQNDYGASSISQYIATKWLNTYHEKHISELKLELKKRKDIFIDALKTHLSMYGSWNDPSGSFYIWFEFSISINVKKLFNESIKENILIQPGEIYDSNYKNYIRFSYSYIDENDINRSLKKLSNIIKKIRN